MLRKIAAALFITAACCCVLGSALQPVPATAQVMVFDGSNFVKNSLTEMHTLQQMYDTAVIKLQEIQRLKLAIQDHQISPATAYQDIQGELDSLRQLMSQNSQVCQTITASDNYFKQYVGPVNTKSACVSPSLAAVKQQIDNAQKTNEQAQRDLDKRAATNTQTAQDARKATSAGQQTADLADLVAGVANEVQAEEQQLARNAKLEATYYDSQISRQSKQDQQDSAARQYWNYYLNGKPVDPTVTPTPSSNP